MTIKSMVKFGSKVEFANFGKSTIAYVRRINSDDLHGAFGEMDDDLPADVDMWGLFSADGQPLAVADEKYLLMDNAEERELVTVNRH